MKSDHSILHITGWSVHVWLDSGKFIATPNLNSNLVCNRTAVLVFTTIFVLINISRSGCFKTHKTGLSFGRVGWDVLSK